MDPHPTPFPAKQRSVAAAPAKTAAPKPKSVATARGKMANKSPTTGNAVSAGAAPQPRPRRAFGTVRSSNSLAEKPAPAPLLKPSKLSAPPNPIRAARPSRPTEKPLKKACPGPDLAAKAKKKSQRVSFKDDVAAVAAPESGEKVKASTEDADRHTPMVPVKALEKKPAKIVAAETPFFSAQNCSSCTFDQLESASYWLAQIRLAESVGKHSVSAAFFRLAFECQAQPFHRIQSELRNYVVHHESASTLTPLFDELLLAHGMAVNQPKFNTDGSEKVDTLTTTNRVDKKLDATTLVHECSECDCGGDLVVVREVSTVKQGEEEMDQLSFERKLDESFEFADCEAVIVDRLAKEHSEFEKNVGVKVPYDSEIIQSVCCSSIDKFSLEGPLVARATSEKHLSSGSPFDKNSPFCSDSLKRLTSSCPSHKKSSTKGLSSKRMSSCGDFDGEHNGTAGAGDFSRVIQEGESGCHALVESFELKEHGEYAAIDEMH